MAEESYASLNGRRLVAARVTVANVGPWFADCDFEDEAKGVEGAAELRIDKLVLRGTILASANGTHGLQRRARVVGGAAGWSSSVAPKSYHNDAGIKARLVAEDAAREVGETLGTFVPGSERVWRDYARQAGPASRALEDVIGGVPWWVDYEGGTNVGPRAAAAADARAYQVLAYDPRERVATLAVDDLAAIGIGSILAEGLDVPQTVRSLEVRLTAGELRVHAWCGGVEGGRGHLAELLRAIALRATDGRLWGHYRYRVVKMSGERVELQAVRRAAGLPDLLPVSVMPGVAGVHAELTPGAECLVAFLEGDRGLPIVVAHSGLDGPGFAPMRLTVGGKEGAPAARQGDAVEVLVPPVGFVGTLNGAPASGTLTFPSMKLGGVIIGGSGKVRIA